MGFQVAICPGKPHVFFPLTFPSKSRRAYLPHHLFWHLQPQDSQKTLAHSSLHWDLHVAHTLARSWHRHRHRPAAGKYRMDVEGLSCQGQGCRIVFGIFLPQVCFFLPQVLFFFPVLVPFALYLQQFGTRTGHFEWYLLHFGMVTLHFAWYLLHLAMFAFHFAWYLSHFGI